MTRYWQEPNGRFIYVEGVHVNIPVAALTEVRVVSLDAIVIERSELPDVTVGRLGLSIGGDEGGWDATADPARWRLNALRDLAIAEYLTAHPPVDEAQVSALAAMLPEIDESYGPLHYARALIATGKVTVTTDGGAS